MCSSGYSRQLASVIRTAFGCTAAKTRKSRSSYSLAHPRCGFAGCLFGLELRLGELARRDSGNQCIMERRAFALKHSHACRRLKKAAELNQRGNGSDSAAAV